MPITAFTDIANCELIIDSENAYTDAGSTLATTDGDIIQQVNDTSGNGRHWTNTGTSSTRPTLLHDPQTGKKVLEFTGNSVQFLNVPNFLNAMGSASTFVWMFRVKNDPAPTSQRGGWLDFGGVPYSTVMWTDGNTYDGCGSTNQRNVFNPANPLTDWSYYVHQAATNLLRSTYLVGSAWNSIVTSSTYGFTSTPVFGKSAAVAAFDGYLRLCVIYSRLLTNAELLDIGMFVNYDSGNYMPPLNVKMIPLLKLGAAKNDLSGGNLDAIARRIHSIGGAGAGTNTTGRAILS